MPCKPATLLQWIGPCKGSLRNYSSSMITLNHTKPSIYHMHTMKSFMILRNNSSWTLAQAHHLTKQVSNGSKALSVVGALLFYARAVDNKLLHALSEIGTQQAAALKPPTHVSIIFLITVPHIPTTASPTMPVT